jgi:hypothetical protein
MHHSVHCSIIGTCLSSAELRRLMIKLGVPGADTAGDHELHKQGVTLAGRNSPVQKPSSARASVARLRAATVSQTGLTATGRRVALAHS